MLVKIASQRSAARRRRNPMKIRYFRGHRPFPRSTAAQLALKMRHRHIFDTLTCHPARTPTHSAARNSLTSRGVPSCHSRSKE